MHNRCLACGWGLCLLVLGVWGQHRLQGSLCVAAPGESEGPHLARAQLCVCMDIHLWASSCFPAVIKHVHLGLTVVTVIIRWVFCLKAERAVPQAELQTIVLCNVKWVIVKTGEESSASPLCPTIMCCSEDHGWLLASCPSEVSVGGLWLEQLSTTCTAAVI